MITNLYGLKAITPTVLYLETAANDWWIALIGAFIGGGASLLATVITHRYNLKQAEFQNYFNRLDFNYYLKEY